MLVFIVGVWAGFVLGTLVATNIMAYIVDRDGRYIFGAGKYRVTRNV